eukprot:4619998-Amphidinium_carterae.1
MPLALRSMYAPEDAGLTNQHREQLRSTSHALNDRLTLAWSKSLEESPLGQNGCDYFGSNGCPDRVTTQVCYGVGRE